MTSAHAAIDAAALPSPAYRPGLASRLVARIDELPWHGLWVWPLLALALAVWGHAIMWITGRLPFGTIDATGVQGVFYGPYGLAVFAVVNRVALHALDAFWPATGWPISEKPRWAYEFVTLPRGLDVLAFGLGTLITIATVASAPEAFLGPEPGRVYALAAVLPSLLLGYAAFPLLAFHTIRQLRLVMRIHREATAINPFDREPVYAFSRLTTATGLAFAVIGYYGLVQNGSIATTSVVSLGTVVGTFAVAIVTFVVPLWGIHDRLVHEKALLMRDVESRIGRLGDEMYRRVDAGQFDGTKVVADSIGGVSMLRERIGKLPTWPWPPNVLRGFVTALLLPVIIYIASRVIGSNFGV